MQIGPVVWEE